MPVICLVLTSTCGRLISSETSAAFPFLKAYCPERCWGRGKHLWLFSEGLFFPEREGWGEVVFTMLTHFDRSHLKHSISGVSSNMMEGKCYPKYVCETILLFYLERVLCDLNIHNFFREKWPFGKTITSAYLSSPPPFWTVCVQKGRGGSKKEVSA